MAVLLGTTRYLSSGRQNLYFKYRIDAAARLYEQGKIDYVLVSGDDSQAAL
ncbi:MAG: hypothetical protein U5L96_14350 [Owenweeksia sp.]|nr:hypothetical protein [Owenweeksia sp.]